MKYSEISHNELHQVCQWWPRRHKKIGWNYSSFCAPCASLWPLHIRRILLLERIQKKVKFFWTFSRETVKDSVISPYYKHDSLRGHVLAVHSFLLFFLCTAFYFWLVFWIGKLNQLFFELFRIRRSKELPTTPDKHGNVFWTAHGSPLAMGCFFYAHEKGM